MITKENMWCASGTGKIVRILSWEEDGCILYSWTDDAEQDTKSNSTLYIRLFNPETNKDDVVLICKTSADILSAYISPDQHAIAFTMWLSSDVFQTKSNFDFIVKAHKKSDQFHLLPKSVTDAMPIKAWQSDENGTPISLSEPTVCRHGVYRSFLAEVYPTGWTMKFDTDRRLQQRVLFTNHITKKQNGDLRLTTYEVLLILHRESIGLYNVELQDNSKISSAKQITSSTSRHVSRRVHGRPTAEVIVDGAIWSQWDAITQRLYYLVPVRRTTAHKPTLKGNKTDEVNPRYCQFVCVQFFESMPLKKVMEVQVDLKISKFALFNKSSLSAHHELNPTVSSQEFNMRVCLFNETGTVCLCWQELSSTSHNPAWLYTIAVIDKELWIRYPTNETIQNKQVAFLVLGQMLLVHCPGEFVHFYDVKNMTCDVQEMSNGLYHMHLPETCFPSLLGCSLEFLTHSVRFIERSPGATEPSVLTDSVDSLSSTASLNTFSNTALCYDSNSGCLILLQFNHKHFGSLFSNEILSIQNRIFLTRFCVASSRSSSLGLSAILDLIMNNPTNLHVTGVLAQLLITSTVLELNDHKQSIPPLVLPLFPTTVPTSCLLRCFNPLESLVEYLNSIDVSLITMQIEQYLASVSLNLRFVVGRSQSVAHTSISSLDGSTRTTAGKRAGNQDTKESLWYRTLNACKSGSFYAYDLKCIREELSIISKATVHYGRKNKPASIPAQSRNLLDQLTGFYARDFLKKVDVASSSTSAMGPDPDLYRGSILSFLNENERDQTSECIIVLTNEKLCDHLSANLPNNPVASETCFNVSNLSRDYIYAQMRSVHHTFTLMMLKSGVEDFERSLFISASNKEQRLLTAVNQFQLVCSMICYPLPNGFQTFVTCLTFRCLLFRFPITKNDEKSDSRKLEERFFGQVDRGMIQLTPEFVARALEELGDKKNYSDILYEVLTRTRNVDGKNCDLASLCGIEQWDDPRAKKWLAKAGAKEIFHAAQNLSVPPSSPEPTSHDGIKFLRSRSSSAPKPQKEVTVPTLLKRMASTKGNAPESRGDAVETAQAAPHADFPPLQNFIDFVRNTEEKIAQSRQQARPRYTDQSLTEMIEALLAQTVST